MKIISPKAAALHEKAKSLASEFRRLESDLTLCLAEVDESRLYFELGLPSLFQYATEALGLTESVAYALITVARTLKQVPELRAEIESGNLSVFKAKKVCSMLIKSSDDQPFSNQQWIDKAKSMSTRKLEQEVRLATLSPDERSQSKTVLELRLLPGQNERWEQCQRLASQSLGNTASPEETLDFLTSFWLSRKDPVERAKRADVRKAKKEKAAFDSNSDSRATRPVQAHEGPKKSSHADAKRIPVPAALLHQVHLRDQKQCQYRKEDGQACGENRFTEVHHIQPLSQGGRDDLANLMTTCSGHHRMIHWQMEHC